MTLVRGSMSALESKFLSMARAALACVPAVHSEPVMGGDGVRVSVPAVAAPAANRNVTIRPVEPPAPKVLAIFASAESVAAGRGLSRGAARLWSVLHRLALDVARFREYVELVRQVVFHCPALTLAGVLGVTDRHLRRLALELEQVGLLDCGGHSQYVAGRSMYDGTLWAVLVVADSEPPRLRADDWKHQWRPDFIDDVEGKTGAAAEMSELLNREVETEERFRAAKARAVTPSAKNPPPLSSSDILPRPSLGAVIVGLGELWHLHATKRAKAVGVLASSICAALGEPDRRRYWCRVIWEAMRDQNEQRGGLQVLAAQFARLEADLKEGAPWRNPGAVLAARLKAA